MAYISKTVLDIVILTKVLTHRVFLQSTHPIFQQIFVLPKMVAIENFQIFEKKIAIHKNAYIFRIIINLFNKQLCFSVAQEKQKMNIHSEDSSKANNYHPAKNIHNGFLPTNLRHNVLSQLLSSCH